MATNASQPPYSPSSISAPTRWHSSHGANIRVRSTTSCPCTSATSPAIIAGFALFTRRPTLLTLTYFWGLGATFQALVTPAITIGPPHLPFIQFFVQHFAIVAAALYIPLVLKWKPKMPWWKTPLKVFGISVVYQGFALLVNTLLKTNFAFASRPPDNPSLIDHLGPWPIYLFVMQLLALAIYLLLALPFKGCKKAGATE